MSDLNIVPKLLATAAKGFSWEIASDHSPTSGSSNAKVVCGKICPAMRIDQ